MNPWIDRFKEQLLAPATPVFYYNADTHDFLFLQDTGTRSGLTDWVPLRPKEAAMALGHRGYKLSPSEGEQMSQVETMLHECRMDPDRTIYYAGDLAGWTSGLHKVCGVNVLVKSEAQIPPAVQGDCAIVRRFIDTLFGPVQSVFVHAFHKMSREALIARNLRAMPAMIIIGERNCGKSFYQRRVMTPLLGGRECNANKYLGEGSTKFNADVLSKEHIMVQDPELGSSFKDRVGFAARIKEIVANEVQSVERKFVQALNAGVFSRVTVTLNSSYEVVSRLPVFDRDFGDKSFLFKAHKADFTVKAFTAAEQLQYLELFASQIPAYCYWLENEFVIPAELTMEPDGEPTRWGLRVYHDPETMNLLTAVSPELRLVELIRQALFTEPDATGSGVRPSEADFIQMTSINLERALKDDSSPVKHEAISLIKNGNAMISYLARLHAKFPDNVFSTKKGGNRTMWTIRRPDEILEISDRCYEGIGGTDGK
jgi:hypothetical protein